MVANRQPSFSDDDEQSIVGGLRDKSIGTLAAVGNVLDLPGSSVRDVLAGKNPFDQYLSPTSSNNRTTGRDLARQYGLAGRRNTWGNAIGGFGAEVALDPLTYLTFGGSALGRAGQAAKGAGLMDDLARVAAAKQGRAIGSVGKRQARLTTTLEDFAKYGGGETAEKASKLISEGSKADEVMGGLAGVGLPFRDPSFVLGTGNRAKRAATAMDSAGQAARYAKVPGTNFAPVNSIARLFDVSLGDTKTPFGQAIAKQSFRDKEKNRVAARMDAGQAANQLSDAGATDEAVGDALRGLVEGTMSLGQVPPQFRGPVSEIADRMRGDIRGVIDRGRELGIKTNELEDDHIDYAARFLTENAGHHSKRDKRLHSAFDPSSMGRADDLRNVPGGTAAIKKMVKDPQLNQMIDEGSASVDDVQQYLRATNEGWLPDQYKKFNEETGAWEEVSGRYRALANRLSKMSPETRQAGIFGNHPLRDHEARMMAFSDAETSAKSLLGALAQPGIMRPAGGSIAESADNVRIGDLTASVGLEFGDDTQGFGRMLRERTGFEGSLKDLRDMSITKEHAEDLTKFMEMMRSPEPMNELLQAIDSVTNFGKGMLTSVWPAFHSRNLVSGQAHNWLLGMGDRESLVAANALARGGVVKDASKIKAIQDEWAKRTKGASRTKLDLGGGSPVDAESASQLFETRGRGVQYHGARGEITDFSEGYYNPDNIYGASDTFYTTDAMDIAAGYGRKKDGAKVYRIEENEPVRFFDMEERLPLNSIKALMGDSDDVVLEALDIAREEALGRGESLPNLREVMDVVREISQDHGLSKDSVQEIFDGVSYNLQSQGFGGMSHIGGLKTKRPAHNVKIYFNPKDQIRVVDTKWAPSSATVAPRELTDEEATKILGELAYANQVIGKFDGNATSVIGQADALQGGTLRDMLTGIQRPGNKSFSIRRSAKKAVGAEEGTGLNPFDVRGVGARVESGFGPAAAGEEVGYYVESLNRIAPFLNQLKKGVDPKEAAKKVGAAQVLYSNRNFTPFEQQVMKRLFPFYSFTSRVSPQILKELAERPGGRLGASVRAQRNAQDSGPMAPDYVRESASIPVDNQNPVLKALIGEAPRGTDRYIAGLGLMHEDPFSFGPNAKGAMLELGSRMNPFVKAPLEFMTGQSFFQKGPDGGRRLDDMDPLIGRLAANVGLADPNDPKILPTWMEQAAANSPAARALSTARQLTDSRKGVVPKLLNTLTGLRVTDVSPGSKDAIVRELLQREMKDTGAAAFERIYFRKEDLARMSPEQRDAAIKLQALGNILAKRAKERKLEEEQQGSR